MLEARKSADDTLSHIGPTSPDNLGDDKGERRSVGHRHGISKSILVKDPMIDNSVVEI
jgi:hypothetical protein